MSNYRGITLLDVVGKLFHKILANRLLQHAHPLHTSQNAFRRGHSVRAHLLQLLHQPGGASIAPMPSAWTGPGTCARRMTPCGGTACCASSGTWGFVAVCGSRWMLCMPSRCGWCTWGG
jgi:hypothetical protein